MKVPIDWNNFEAMETNILTFNNLGTFSSSEYRKGLRGCPADRSNRRHGIRNAQELQDIYFPCGVIAMRSILWERWYRSSCLDQGRNLRAIDEKSDQWSYYKK